MRPSPLLLFWDKAHIWGLLLRHGLAGLGLPYRVIRGAAVARGLLERFPGAVLVVPGGFSRQKMEALGPRGTAAVRAHLASGGAYFGVCGGAGFAIEGENRLGLCPYVNVGFANRLHHFASGHVQAELLRGDPLIPDWLPDLAPLPVWWPARFAPDPEAVGRCENGAPRVLATYGKPCPDFLMADIPVADLPGAALAEWAARYGADLDPAFLAGAPFLISGAYGRGRFVLSHAHLETPGSPLANSWLAHILAVLGGEAPGDGFRPLATAAPAWDLEALPVRFDDSLFLECAALLDAAVSLGLAHGLLYRRNSWLFGWRPGTPGFAISNLHALFRQARALEPTRAALDYWRSMAPHFHRILQRFAKGLTGYFLAERLAWTLARFDPEAVPEAGLAAERRALFGPPPGTGGLCGELLGLLDQLVWLLLAEESGLEPAGN